MKSYLDLCRHVLNNGEQREDRTGTGTISVFGDCSFKHDLSHGFPLLTTKKMFWNGVVDELLWFLSGSMFTNDLPERSRKLWEPWANKEYVGPLYGYQWRSWVEENEYDYNVHDQIYNVIESIKKDPYSRRHIVSAWNVSDLDKMALQPCHILFQFYVSNDKKLSLKLYQRSGDLFLGVPFNIASYALLTHMVAQVTQLTPGTLYITYGDLHIYNNHIPQIKEQMTRQPQELSQLILSDDIKSIDDFSIDNIVLKNYNPLSKIVGEISV